MCGISGEFHYQSNAGQVDPARLLAVRDQMLSRGPDGCGVWTSPDNRVGLAHRRLAILDLSELGAQPMLSHTGDAVISFNGEIFNFQELRDQLRASGVDFRSDGDTEVLLALYRDRGLSFLSELRGMFAFALWDSTRQELILVRDRFGIKPLYYSDSGTAIYFASQVRALLGYPQISRELDPVAQCGFFLTGSVPEPHTMFKAIRCLAPGSYVRIDSRGVGNPEVFGSVEAEFGAAPLATAGLRETVEDSVRKHLLSDAPCGFFLSAGLDSSTLVGCAAQIGHPSIQTVTLGFDRLRGTAADETVLAEQIAKLYRTEHQTVWISGDDFFASIQQFWSAMDQPSIDGINSFFVSKAAHDAGLTVALSGLGADELFGGYPSFREIPRLVSALGWITAAPAVGSALTRLLLPLASKLTSPKYAGVFEFGGTYPGAYLLRRGLFLPSELPGILSEETLKAGLREFTEQYLAPIPSVETLSAWEQVSLLELTRYMRNQLLRDTDWASMAHSLEVRVPFVDSKLLQLVAQRAAAGSPLVKQDLPAILKTPLPEAVRLRAKTGFSVPVRDWIHDAPAAHGGAASDTQSEIAERGLRGWARVVYKNYLAACGLS